MPTAACVCYYLQKKTLRERTSLAKAFYALTLYALSSIRFRVMSYNCKGINDIKCTLNCLICNTMMMVVRGVPKIEPLKSIQDKPHNNHPHFQCQTIKCTLIAMKFKNVLNVPFRASCWWHWNFFLIPLNASKDILHVMIINLSFL